MKLSLRTRYILFVVFLHSALIFLTFNWLREDKLLFIASEVLLVLSIIASVQIYRDFLKPIEFVRAGIEAIKDRDFTIKFVPSGKSEVDVLINVYNLMIDQLRLERTKLNEQHYFLEKLIEASPIAILILDFDEKITTVNSRARTMLGIGTIDCEGKRLVDLDVPLLTQLNELQDGQSRTIKNNGVETYKVQRSHFMDRGFRRSFLMVEELTADILESEKKAYGKVIRMMAHEVNNTMGATDSIIQTTLSYLPQEEYGELMEALRIATERNRQLSRFMRNFADVVRLPLPRKELTDLNKLIKDVVLFMQPMAALRGVVIKTSSIFTPNLVPLDKGQIEQVLVNILKNAMEACESGMEIRVEVSECRLVIRNNGRPIPAEVEAQLFNPFFSTKPDGQGIGLTLTRDILLNHGFVFSLKSKPDGWTEFTIDVQPGES
ncbi:PAS domain-containing sensor histidine kinase [Telluribacter sp. SYSU D00476]|uniref:sensor histidine kinase n=1 Tax=Telluribacter sp. SYSU D00476 TaxID=2811430 RepID=UPI001FF620BA|nr:ATP-binding protein [Telluribacter sp. SYSU D00476]